MSENENEVETEEDIHGREVHIYDPRNTGETISRKDFCIREVGEFGRTRQEVAKQLTVIEDVRDSEGNLKEIPYQTVYSVTKPDAMAKLGYEVGSIESTGGLRGSPESAAASLQVDETAE